MTVWKSGVRVVENPKCHGRHTGLSCYIMFDFQEEVIRVAGEESLELGLLFGTENLTPQEEETDVLCFAHLLIQEFVGAYFLSKFDKVH